MLFRKRTIQRYIATGLILLMAASARAQVPDTAAPGIQTKEVDQLIYKGVVGNLLDNVPLDPEERVDLQRANAVVGNAFTGRSLAMLLGVTNPVLMIGGLMWGLFAATRIKPAKRAPAASVAAAGVCGEDWRVNTEAAAPAPASPAAPPRDEVASAQP